MDYFALDYIYHEILGLTCPNRYEPLMFFDPLAISEIILKNPEFFSQKQKRYK